MSRTPFLPARHRVSCLHTLHPADENGGISKWPGPDASVRPPNQNENCFFVGGRLSVRICHLDPQLALECSVDLSRSQPRKRQISCSLIVVAFLAPVQMAVPGRSLPLRCRVFREWVTYADAAHEVRVSFSTSATP